MFFFIFRAPRDEKKKKTDSLRSLAHFHFFVWCSVNFLRHFIIMIFVFIIRSFFFCDSIRKLCDVWCALFKWLPIFHRDFRWTARKLCIVHAFARSYYMRNDITFHSVHLTRLNVVMLCSSIDFMIAAIMSMCKIYAVVIFAIFLYRMLFYVQCNTRQLDFHLFDSSNAKKTL